MFFTKEVLILKLQSVSFASLSPSLCRIIFSVWVVFRLGSSTDESNVLRSMYVSQSVWILYLGITDSSLRLRIYDPNKNCHCILQVCHFVLTTEEKNITINRATNGDSI